MSIADNMQRLREEVDSSLRSIKSDVSALREEVAALRKGFKREQRELRADITKAGQVWRKKKVVPKEKKKED